MKKALLVVSFGTTHSDTRKLTLDKIEDRIRERFTDYEVRRAYTSHIIIRILKARDGLLVDTIEEAFDKLRKERFEEVVIQPLHLIAGLEYEYILKIAKDYKEHFKKLSVGRPILFFKSCEKDYPDDYEILMDALKDQIPPFGLVIFMGHGSSHPSNASYSCLQMVARDKGFHDVFIANVEGYPQLKNVLGWIKKNDSPQKVITLMPLMIVVGEHAKNDMAGKDAASWKNILEKEGYQVNLYMHGLGEIEKFQDIYIEHIKDVIDHKYPGYGENKKGDT